MSWRQQLRVAHFRGVRFQVSSHDSPTGRRIHSQEYPYRDEPSTDDLGRKQRTYNISAYLIGEDYHNQRDRLIKACEKQGAGTLSHPVFGVKIVRCTDCTSRETTSEGRMARVDLAFVEAGQTNAALSKIDQFAKVAANGLQLADDAVDNFLTYWNLEGAPSYVIGVAQDSIATVSSWLTGLAAPTTPTGGLSELKNLGTNAANLVTAPTDLAQSLRTGIENIFGTGTNPEQVQQSFGVMAQYGNNVGGFSDGTAIGSTPLQPSIDTSTPSGETLDESMNGLVIAIRANAIFAATQVIEDLEFEYEDQALNLRDEILDAIDALMLNEFVSDQLYAALADVRSSLVESIPNANVELPKVIDYSLVGETPALVLAHRLYGPQNLLDRENEIVQRNAIQNPNFLPTSRTLKVLNA